MTMLGVKGKQILTTMLLMALAFGMTGIFWASSSPEVQASANGDASTLTQCWWEYRYTASSGAQYWCYRCCNHPDLPPGCHDLFCEWR